MSARTFISTTGKGIARAWLVSEGEWEIEHLLRDQDVRCLAVDPLNPEVVYAGTQGKGVLRSQDRGRSWKGCGLEGRIVKSIAASPVEPGVLYAGLKPPRLMVSRDGGARWKELEAFLRIRSRLFWFSPAEMPLVAYVQAIALSPTDPQAIAVGIEAGALVFSRDGGKSWSDHRRGALRDCHSLTFHVADGRWLYEAGGTGAGAAVSRDGGVAWAQPRSGLDRHYGWAVAADPAAPDTWYVSASPGPSKAHSGDKAEAAIFRSRQGEPWVKLTGGLPLPLNHMPYTLLTDPQSPGQLYAGLSNGDVWHSTDHGDGWQRLPFCLGAIHRSLIML